MRLPDPFQQVIRALSLLPGVGARSAQRFGFHLLDHPDQAQAIAQAVSELPERIAPCVRCYNLADRSLPDGLCAVCSDPHRDRQVLCVVESIPHLLAVEGSGSFRGRYHVLHGSLSPIKGVGPEELRIPELVARVREERCEEVIVATDVDTEGEATSAYLVEVLGPLGLRVSRIATGVPMGSDLEYVDGTTLARALAGRKPQ